MISKEVRERAKKIAKGDYTPPEKQEIIVTFELTKKQWNKYKRWRKAKTKKEGELYVGAIGGSYTFCFTPTGIGEIATVKAADGEELDLTDYNNW